MFSIFTGNNEIGKTKLSYRFCNSLMITLVEFLLNTLIFSVCKFIFGVKGKN